MDDNERQHRPAGNSRQCYGNSNLGRAGNWQQAPRSRPKMMDMWQGKFRYMRKTALLVLFIKEQLR